VETPALLLPPISRLTPHLSIAGSASWTAPDGLHFSAITPFPGASALVSQQSAILGETALMTSILLPSLNRARETANRVKCASNLRQIGQGCVMYANDHKGAYPPDLGAIIKNYEIPLDSFVCPTRGTPVPPEIFSATDDKKAAWVNENTDYVYLGKGMNNTATPDTVVCYEKRDNHGGDGMNILFGDGHIEFLRMPDAKKMIEKTNAAKDGVGL
jgi:prepilin-type processing-associated H-X9-DG protein